MMFFKIRQRSQFLLHILNFKLHFVQKKFYEIVSTQQVICTLMN